MMKINQRVAGILLIVVFAGPILFGGGIGLYRWATRPKMQAFSENDLRKTITVGMSQDQVRKTLGRPWRVLKDDIAWMYQNQPPAGAVNTGNFIAVIFHDGKVIEVGTTTITDVPERGP